MELPGGAPLPGPSPTTGPGRMHFESPFQTRIRDARARAAELGGMTGGDPLLRRATDELLSALEELEVSDEELRVQNESMAASQLMLDTERQRYADLFHLAPEPYLVTGPDGTIRESNRAASELLGVMERGLAGKPLAVFVVGADLRKFREQVNRAAAGARVNDFEVTLTPRRGAPVRVSCTVQPAARLLPGGQALWWILRDVTERRRAEEAERLLAAEHAARRAAERAERRLARVLEGTSDAFFSLDAKGRFTYVNQGAEALWGADRAGLLGRTAAEAFPGAADWAVADAPAVALAEGRAVRAEAWSPLAGRWVEVSAFPTESGVAVFFRDVQDRHRRAAAERLLAETGEALSASLDGDEMLRRVAEVAAAAVGGWCVLRVGAPGAQVACAAAHHDRARSAALQAILHGSPFDPAGSHPVARAMRTGEASLLEGSEHTIAAAFPDPAQREQVREMGAASGVVVPLQARGRTLGALILVRGPAQPAFDGQDLALAGELARRTAMGVDNARLYRDSCAATQAREEVLAVVSHDLRNPLNAVLLASVILDEYGAPESLGERERLQVRTIRNAAEQMSSLIHDLVEVVALEAGTRTLQRDLVQPVKAMHAAAEMYHGLAAERGIVLAVDAGADVPDVHADRARLLQVLSNLLGNAVKFSPDGATVTVGAAPSSDGVGFWVSDSGPGIDPAHLPRLFDRFWQARRGDRAGLGLGLAIAKGIVDAHGGRIWAESVPGQGSTFFFTLPLTGDAS